MVSRNDQNVDKFKNKTALRDATHASRGATRSCLIIFAARLFWNACNELFPNISDAFAKTSKIPAKNLPKSFPNTPQTFPKHSPNLPKLVKIWILDTKMARAKTKSFFLKDSVAPGRHFGPQRFQARSKSLLKALKIRPQTWKNRHWNKYFLDVFFSSFW